MSRVTVLAQQLQDKQLSVRAQAAQRLAECGEEACGAAVALVQACADEESVREYAVAALEDLGRPPQGVVDQLRGLIGDPNELVAYWAVTLLGRLGATAGAVAPALASIVADAPHVVVRQRAAWALGQIGSREAVVVAALERARDDADPRLSRLAAQALAQLN
jgi:HEAT repeat protein